MTSSEDIDCSIKGCNKSVKTLGMCSSHYMRLWRYGNAEKRIKTRGHVQQYFLDTIKVDTDKCLVWPYYRNPTGYGQVGYKNKLWLVHKLALVLTKGEAPKPDLQAAHSCGNGNIGCFNPKHLRWATRAENMAEMVKHGRSVQGEKHHMNKLKTEQILSIREDKRPNYILADIYSVSQVTISDIRRRRSWSWL